MVHSCSRIQLEVDPLDYSELNEVSVINPDPAGCAGVGYAQFRIVPPPTINMIVPSHHCAVNTSSEINVVGEST